MEKTFDFNQLRENYPHMTLEDKRRVYQQLYELFPLQNEFAFDFDFILQAFDRVQPTSVIELGGYEGRLALEIFKRGYSINSWINLELFLHHQHAELTNYPYREMIWNWQPIICDLFLSAHTLEHLSNQECIQVLNWLQHQKIKHLLLIIPVEPEGQSWHNYFGAHTLTLGSKRIKKELSESFKLIMEREIGKNQDGGWCSLWQA